MTDTSPPADGSDAVRRLAALGALLLGGGALLAGVLSLRGDVGRAVVAVILVLVTVGLAWSAATRSGRTRLVAGVFGVVGAAGVVLVILTAEARGVMAVVVVALLSGSAASSKFALRRDRTSLRAADTPGTPVGPAQRGVLIMNLKSGGGKAERFRLEEEARRVGVEPVVLGPGDDLRQLAQDAIDRGADVIGMAGGDGSQALVASVAMSAGVAMVCIPAGTRNHFALDLGLDRDDVVGALDAYADAVERRIDLATVGDRVFVNNVSLGVYAKVVQSAEYRDAKGQTTTKLLPEMLGPDAEQFDLRYTGPDGSDQSGAQLIMVSNNPYRLTGLGGVGSRARLDTGALGVVTVEIHGAREMSEVVAAQAAGRIQRFRGYEEWSTPSFTVHSDSPVEAGVDGEALLLDPPLEFRCHAGALRVRVSTASWGSSPAALKDHSLGWTLRALVGLVAGRGLPEDASGA